VRSHGGLVLVLRRSRAARPGCQAMMSTGWTWGGRASGASRVRDRVWRVVWWCSARWWVWLVRERRGFALREPAAALRGGVVWCRLGEHVMSVQLRVWPAHVGERSRRARAAVGLVRRVPTRRPSCMPLAPSLVCAQCRSVVTCGYSCSAWLGGGRLGEGSSVAPLAERYLDLR
jgi:hypothetical protein